MMTPNDAKTWHKGVSGDVGDVLNYLGPRTVPAVTLEANVDDMIQCFAASTHSRVIYVTDAEGRLEGTITQQELVKHVFLHYHDEYLDKRALLSHAISESAADIMHNERRHCMASDSLEELLADMISFHQDEVPVVDNENKLIYDITMMDIIRYCAQKRENGDL